MKNIKVSDEIHKEIVEWCDHKLFINEWKT